MNEHIEAYLKQHHCRDYFNSYGETVEDDHYFMYREEVDGLIELIVRECVKIAYQNDIAKFTRDGYIIGMDIQKHFGVDQEDSACPLCGEDGGTTCGMPGCQY